ncbi:MAG: Crp/Fnr family transcriptional regulator [Clostridiales bacterium]|nr:Crp/Fnr family transcriptional regulator [Clostridiales bacterium]
MKKFSPVLRASPLFAGIGDDGFDAMLGCLGARTRAYAKDETIYFEGDAVTEIGLVLDGRLHLIKDDMWGNASIVAEIAPPDMFAEAVVCGGIGTAPVNVVAKEASEVLFIDYQRVLAGCPSACAFHAALIRNMIGILARKNITLAAKLEHLAKRTTREKLLSYLAEQARQKKSGAFDIPFNRQELADYLFVERSALSAEMSRLKADGRIDYRKNHFILRKE